MTIRRMLQTAATACLCLIPASLSFDRAKASDHADTAENYNRIGADMTDVFIFPSPANDNNVVVVMDVHGLIPAGQTNLGFDPQVLYQMKFDVTGDYVEDLVIQARFVGVGRNQTVVVSGPHKPATTGTTAIFGRPSLTGPTNAVIGTTPGLPIAPTATVIGTTPNMKVFAGIRSEPFFFDLNRFFAILPDRGTPLTGAQVETPNPDTPQVNGFRGFPAGSGFDSSPAMDFFADLNVLSIIVELPRSMLGGGTVHLWETTSLPIGAPGFRYTQQDRLARPAINEVLATVTANRHEANNKDNPTDDRRVLYNDIVTFMTNPNGANRKADVAAALATALTPDVMTADLSNMTDKASYLGVETGGFTGGKFGGRDLKDDVVDIDLMAIFGPVVPALGLAPEDNRELPQFTTDHVGHHNDFLTVFPYLGAPH